MDYSRGIHTGRPEPVCYPQAKVPIDEPPSSSPIRDLVTETEQLLGELANSMDMMEKRLDTILLPTAPSGSSSEKAGRPINSHLFDRLADINLALQMAITRLHDVRSRVQI